MIKEEFWNSLLIQKSWNMLQQLKKLKINFIIIGGWAVWLWTRTLKSKDIDIVITDFDALNYLKSKFGLSKNDELKKYEIKKEEIDIDVYSIYFSKLAVPIEDMKKHTTKIEGFSVPISEILLILKQEAEISRSESVKGEKDRIDVMSLLLNTKINFKKYKEFLKKYNLNYLFHLKRIINQFRDFDKLDLNPRQYKLKKQKILKEI